MSENTKTPTEITADFVARCAQKLGMTMTRENKSWIVFQDQRTQHKLCVSITKGEAPKIDTTVDITSLPGVLKRGVDTKVNGRFVSLFTASSDLIQAALKAMASPDAAHLPAVKRGAKKAPVAFLLDDLSDEQQ